MKKLTFLIGMIITGFAASAQLSDTLYYKNGNPVICKIQSLGASDVVVFVKTNGDKLLSKSVDKSWLDSIYLADPGLLSDNANESVGDNLIVSGVSTIVGWAAAIIGYKADKFEEGAVFAIIAQVVSVFTLINAGIISNKNKPPAKELQHTIVF
jgi:hypothetical protein